MGKRKGPLEIPQDGNESPSENSASEESSDDDENVVDVEFEWFDPQPEHDFHGIKTLLRQLLDSDAHLIDISALTDLILAQPLLGSTVKVEGNETDPYAFLTVLSLKEHASKSVIANLHQYIVGRAQTDLASSGMSQALGSKSNSIGLILTERLINVPPEVVPPMYNMLLEEVTWALEEKEPYDFTHYLILSKRYREVDPEVDAEDDDMPKQKKQKKSKRPNTTQAFYFHPEDEILHNFASAQSDYDYASGRTDGQSDSKRAFQDLGIQPIGHMILIEAQRFNEAVKALQQPFERN